jgi:glycine cleavage system H protein
MTYKFPSELDYTTTHEWVRIDSEIAVVGITDFAQHQLGDIVFVELPDVGMVFEKESNAGEIESVKAVGDLIMPLSGEIISVTC